MVAAAPLRPRGRGGARRRPARGGARRGGPLRGGASAARRATSSHAPPEGDTVSARGDRARAGGPCSSMPARLSAFAVRSSRSTRSRAASPARANLPFAALAPAGRFLAARGAARRLSLGVRSGDECAYCGSGVAACVLLLAAEVAGSAGAPLPRLVERMVGARPPVRARLGPAARQCSAAFDRQAQQRPRRRPLGVRLVLRGQCRDASGASSGEPLDPAQHCTHASRIQSSS